MFLRCSGSVLNSVPKRLRGKPFPVDGFCVNAVGIDLKMDSVNGPVMKHIPSAFNLPGSRVTVLKKKKEKE